MDELTRIKFPGDPLSETELEKLASITAKDQNEAIATANSKLKEYLEATRANRLRPKQ